MKKHMNNRALLCVLLCALLVLTGCASMAPDSGMDFKGEAIVEGVVKPDGLSEEGLVENPFVSTAEQNVSTFSADVDTASYSYFRKLVKNGYTFSELKATAGGIRTEELVNYFSYNYTEPQNGELFGTSASVSPCPYNAQAVLLTLGLQTAKTEVGQKNNLVFLIDVSGSMYGEDKLELLKTSFQYLTERLGADDTVSIVTYAGADKVVLEGCSGSKTEQINAALKRLTSEGSTNGEAGLKRAYALAEKYFIPDGNNRIILASDGDLNVGMSTTDEIKAFVSEKRKSGVYLSVLGFGTGNYRDSMMETIADCGNGVYYYIDGAEEAEKVFGQDLFSTLYSVAEDVKLQLSFNADCVGSYRLVGYENRLLNNEDFEDDTKDAGELGAGHRVTVCYELILTDKAMAAEESWMSLFVRYKNPGEDKSKLNEYAFGKDCYTENPGDEFTFKVSLIELAMLLHGSKYCSEQVTLESVYASVAPLDLSADSYKQQYVQLLKTLLEAK